MARSKVKLAFIQNASARRATYRKRTKGLKKVVSELSTLCDVKSCAIIYGAYSPEPEVWPSSQLGVQEVLTRFKGMPEYQRNFKMENQESLTRESIKKAEERLMKLQTENRYKEVTQFMFRLLMDEPIIDQNILDLLDMGSIAEEIIIDIARRIAEERMEKSP